MRPIRSFAAERVAVQHCPELVRAVHPSFDMATGCTEFAAELALALPARLESLLLGPRILVSAWPAEPLTASALASSWSGPSIHFAISLGPALPRFVASFDNALALALTDRLFGGRGEAADETPKVLPQSAVHALERLVRGMADPLAATCGVVGGEPALACQQVLHRLGVFKRNARCLRFGLTVEQVGADPWNLSFAVEEGPLRALLERRAAGSARPVAKPTDPQSPAFAGIPLTLTATLAELHLPLSRLAEVPAQAEAEQ